MPPVNPWGGSHLWYLVKSSDKTNDQVIRADTSAAKSSENESKLEIAVFRAPT